MPSKSPSMVGRAVAALLLTIAFYGLAILIAGTVLALPGADIELMRDRLSVVPFQEVHGWREAGAAAAATWASRCRELGLAGVPVLAQE